MAHSLALTFVTTLAFKNGTGSYRLSMQQSDVLLEVIDARARVAVSVGRIIETPRKFDKLVFFISSVIQDSGLLDLDDSSTFKSNGRSFHVFHYRISIRPADRYPTGFFRTKFNYNIINLTI